MVERCVEAVPSAHASFLVVEDSFGFTKMSTGYDFTAHFSPAAGGRTAVRIETFYIPANPIAVRLNKLVMRRRLLGVVDQLLGLDPCRAHHLAARVGRPLGQVPQ
jgi:hypothetical protein